MNNIFTPLIEVNNIQPDVIYFLLLIPFIVMVATVARHFVGLKIFSMFVFVGMSLIIGFLIREETAYSILISLIVLLFTYFFSYFIKRITNSLSLHYFSRISFVVTLISILLLVLLYIAGSNKAIVTMFRLDELNAFAIGLAVLMSEYFSSHRTQKGIRSSRRLFFYTLLFATLVGFLISWDVFQTFLFNYPFFVLVFLLVTYLVGRYTGLRITELNRFKDIETDEDNDE